MKKIIIILLILVVCTVTYAVYYDKVGRFSGLKKSEESRVTAEYEKPFIAKSGTLIQFPDFDLLARGEVDISMKQKWHNMLGYVNSSLPNYYFQVRSKDGIEIQNVQLSFWPFSHTEFNFSNKEYTILPIKGREGGTYLLGQGDLDHVRDILKNLYEQK